MPGWHKPKTAQDVPHRDPNKAMKLQTALDLRLKGHSYREIAEACGYKNPGTVHHLIQQELDRQVTLSVAAFRQQQNDRLDALLAACFEAATDANDKGRTWFIDRALAIIQAQNKLNGLDVRTEDLAVAQNVRRVYEHR